MRSIKLIPVFLAILLGCCSSSESGAGGREPSGRIVLQTSIPLADPFILLHEGTYYAYGTSSDNGFEVYHSTDLTYWKKHPAWLLHKNDSYADRWFWAPEVYYNPAEQTFYLYYSADEHICVATAASPLGPFKQQVKQPMRVEKAIDSSLFVDEDGTAYLFFVRFTDGNVIWGARLESDRTTIRESTLVKCMEASQPWEKLMGKVAEGPSVVKKDGVYYMLYSANDYRSEDYGVGYATAPSPLGPWTKSADNPILHKPRPTLWGAGHGAVFTDRDGRLRYVFHAHASPGSVQPRKMYITDLSIGAAGVKMDPAKIVYPQQVQ